MLIQAKKPITYRLLTQPQPGEVSAAFIEMVLTKNGVFARGKREGLEVAVLVSQVALPGSLYELQPYLKLAYPKPDPPLLEQMLELARMSYDPQTDPRLEILFYLYWEQARKTWQLYVPQQERTPFSVRPMLETERDKEIYAQTLIEVHTHTAGSAYFSSMDDQDERTGFRIFGCLAQIFSKPQIRLRVGLHGYFWEFEAKQLWELGSQVEDALSQDQEGDQQADELTS